MKVTKEYWTEKIEAYNIAIQALYNHEPAEGETRYSRLLRDKLALKLDREIGRWCNSVQVSGDNNAG